MNDGSPTYVTRMVDLQKEGLFKLFKHVCDEAPLRWALALSNLRFRRYGADVHVGYDAALRAFKIRSDQDVIYISQRNRIPFYRRGVATRARKIAEEYLLNAVPFEANDLVIDCGANVGDLYFWFRPKGVRYVGVEPSPADFFCLSRNAVDGDVRHLGLWRESGELDFYVSAATADSSLIPIDAYEEIIKVPTRRLDELFPDEPIKLLKLEAEGAEIEVLEGAEAALPNIRYIAADLGFERGVAQESTFAPVVNTLAAKGFELLDVNHKRVTALFRNRRDG
ncbi:MAG: FkbM family methyltransferase [Pseudomonadota bacterium]